MNDERMKVLYDGFRDAQRRSPRVTQDAQTSFVEGLEFVLAASGSKPSFFALTTETGRAEEAELLSTLVPQGVHSGKGELHVHRLYRAYRTGDVEVDESLHRQSRIRLPVFWISTDDRLAAAYEEGEPDRFDDTELLGYPLCCAEWHYDAFFARGIEAFCAVAKAEGASREGLLRLLDGFVPSSGYFLPDEIFLAAILRSNVIYPFVSHVACPACCSGTTTASRVLNDRAAAVAISLDPEGVERLRGWCRTQERVIASVTGSMARIVDDAAEVHAMGVRGEDVYRKHVRHLLKALALR